MRYAKVKINRVSRGYQHLFTLPTTRYVCNHKNHICSTGNDILLRTTSE